MFLVACFADEASNKKDDKDDRKTIHGSNVSARVLARSGKIMIVRNEKDDNDDKEGSTDVDSDSKDGKDGNNDDKDDKDEKDSNDDNDDKDDDDDEDFRDDNEDLLSFELDEIKEKDSDGNEVDDKHSVKSFDDVEFTFGHVDRQSMFQRIPVITLNLSTYLSDPKANLEIIVYLFREAGSINFGNETFAVQSGTVKFNIKVGIKNSFYAIRELQSVLSAMHLVKYHFLREREDGVCGRDIRNL